jgi:hypothetical protein
MNPLHRNSLAAGVKANNRDKNDELYILLVTGDDAARRQMIEGNMGLVLNKVDHFLKSFPAADFLRDDLIAEGLLALAESVAKMAQQGYVDNPNPVNYICNNVQFAIGALVDEELQLQAPSRTQRHARNRGKDIKAPVQVTVEPSHIDAPQDPTSMSDLADLIDACCESQTERDIVRLRQESYTDQEISKQLGVPHSTTYVLRRGIYARFLEKSEMKGEV